MIYILTGDVRTGKTTALKKWVEGRTDADGILCPDGEDGKRYFFAIKSRETVALEVKGELPQQQELISVGRFHFLKHAFEQANAYIFSVFEKKDYTFLVIDELGKLELKNTGLHAAAKTVIHRHESDKDLHLLLVVRKSLLQNITAHYGLRRFQCITKEELDTLDA